MQMRMFDSEGMDGPSKANRYTVCIDDGEDYYVPLNSDAAIPADVGYIKTALWWYDRRHGSDGSLDDLDLAVEYKVGDNWVAVESEASGDNKEFVFLDGTSSTFHDRRARIRIFGSNVTTDGEGCGSDSMRAYMTYFYEDEDRDDADGPNDESVIAREDRKAP